MLICLTWTQPFILIICKTLTDEVFCCFRNLKFARCLSRKYYFLGIQNNSLTHNFILTNPFSIRFLTIKQLKKYNTYWPYVHFRSNFRVMFYKSLWWQVPISPYSLRCQLNFRLLTSNRFAKSKVENFDQPIMEHYIWWLKVIMNDFFFKTWKVI